MTTLHVLFTCSQIVVIVLLLAVMESSRMREIHYKRLRDNLNASRDAFSTGIENLESRQNPGSVDDTDRDAGPLTTPAINLSRRDTLSTGLNATNHERGSAAQEFEGGVK